LVWIANFDPYLLKPEAERALKPGDAFHECAKDCPEMVVVPAGKFLMGSPATEKGALRMKAHSTGSQSPGFSPCPSSS
jgi:formylglycine-generating enzyme required for sulfatase activity